MSGDRIPTDRECRRELEEAARRLLGRAAPLDVPPRQVGPVDTESDDPRELPPKRPRKDPER